VTRSVVRLLACVLALLTAPAAWSAPPTVSEHVQQNVRKRVDLKYHPGVVIGLINGEGSAYFHYGATALTDGAPLSEHTVFEIGSITKVFTAIALVRLVEQGKLGLEDSLAGHLPEPVTVPTRGERPIRLVDLATHTSGLPRMPANFEPEDPANPFADYTVEQMYEFLSNHELRREPGSEYEYSNYGAGLLGHVLAQQRDVSYEQLVRDTITAELEMDDTAIALSDAMQARLARPHSSVVEVSNWDIPTLAGAGALRSTASDMLRFLAANMGLRSSSLLDAMRTTHEVRYPAGGPMQVGLGWHMRETDDREIIWHNGGTGGYRTFAGFRRDGSLGAVVLTNGSQSPDDLGFHLLDPALELWDPPEKKKMSLFKKDDEGDGE
jgi:CubicO group peptidase (beta-lactamase class C family)